MKILYISQYFFPEVGATSNRSAAIMRSMREHGHDVTLLCEMPNHPQGVIHPAYKGKFIVKEYFEGIPVWHLPVIASPKKNFLTRIAMYLSFSFSAIFFILFSFARYDLIYVTSPPLFTALCGILSKWLYPKRKLVFEVRDLWPDSAIQLGELKNPLLRKASLYLESSVYCHSDLVVCATRYISEVIHRKGINPSKIVVSRNGVDDVILDSFIPQEKSPEQSEFTAIFTGNMGVVLQLETILQCADLMRDEPLRFLFVGGGPSMASLMEMAAKLKLDKVEFRDQVPQRELGAILSNADFGMVELKDLPISIGILPVKIYDYMAFKLPTIAALEGEAADIINAANAGIVIPLANPQAMKDAFLSLINDPRKRQKMGEDARSYVLANFRRRQLSDDLVEDLERRFG